MLLEPASDRYFEPPEHAVLLGVFDGTTNGQCGATKVSMVAYFQAGAMARLDRVGRGVRAVGWTAADVADGQRTGVRIHCAAIGMPSSERSRMTDFTGVAAPLLRQYPGAA